jgi:hypothetical protein
VFCRSRHDLRRRIVPPPRSLATQDDSEDHVPATIQRIVRGWIHIGATNGSVQRRRPRLASDLELTYPRANFRYAGFAYRCAQKPSLFVASLGAYFHSYSPLAMV